jgi:hypothetical protein
MQNHEQWQLFVKSLFRAQFTRKKFNPEDVEKSQPQNNDNQSTSVAKTLSDVLYDESQGITDLAVKMYMFAQERAIDTGKEIVTANIIRSVAKDKFAMLRDVLKALRYEDKRALTRWDDVYPAALKEYLASIPLKGNPQVKIEGNASSDPALRTTLNDHNVGVKQEQERESQPARESADTISDQPDALSRNSISKRNKQHAARVQGVLPGIIASLEKKNDTAAYEALKQAGYVRSPSDHV